MKGSYEGYHNFEGRSDGSVVRHLGSSGGIVGVFVLIRTVLVMLYALTVLVITLPYLLFVHFSKNRWRLADRYVRGLVRSILFLLGVRIDIRGQALRRGPSLFVANHTSNVDVAAAIATLPSPKGFVAKIEMKKIPILAWWMKEIGCVFIDRDNLRQQVRELRQAQDNLTAGLSYMIFPEGTRSREHALLEFKPGAFRMATKTNTPIQPIGFSGMDRIMKKGSPLIFPGRVIINVGAAVTDTECYDKDSAELTRILRAEVRRLVEEVEGEGSYPFAEEIGGRSE